MRSVGSTRIRGITVEATVCGPEHSEEALWLHVTPCTNHRVLCLGISVKHLGIRRCPSFRILVCLEHLYARGLISPPRVAPIRRPSVHRGQTGAGLESLARPFSCAVYKAMGFDFVLDLPIPLDEQRRRRYGHAAFEIYSFYGTRQCACLYLVLPPPVCSASQQQNRRALRVLCLSTRRPARPPWRPQL